MKTHEKFIAVLRKYGTGGSKRAISMDLAADLLDLHDRTSLSLDNWETARKFVRAQLHGLIDDRDLTDDDIDQIFGRDGFPFPNGA